eukprot:5708516-Pleurochrysis_carterae.AAC.1
MGGDGRSVGVAFGAQGHVFISPPSMRVALSGSARLPQLACLRLSTVLLLSRVCCALTLPSFLCAPRSCACRRRQSAIGDLDLGPPHGREATAIADRK